MGASDLKPRLCGEFALLGCVVHQLFNLLPHELLDRLGEGRPNADSVDRAQYLVLFFVLAMLTNRIDVKPTFSVHAGVQVFAALDLATALAFAHSQKTGSASGGDDGSSQMDTAYIAMVIVVVLVIVVVTDDDA